MVATDRRPVDWSLTGCSAIFNKKLSCHPEIISPKLHHWSKIDSSTKAESKNYYLNSDSLLCCHGEEIDPEISSAESVRSELVGSSITITATSEKLIQGSVLFSEATVHIVFHDDNLRINGFMLSKHFIFLKKNYG